MMKAVRKLLGREKFEKPDEPVEFGYIRPILESYKLHGYSMGKTPENPAIVVQIDGTDFRPSLELRLKEIAEQYGFEVEVTTSEPYSNMSHVDSVNRR